MSSTLFQALENISDPRAKRGVRHPLHPILKLVVWGFTSGLVAIEHIVAYCKPVWETLGAELGFTRPKPPDPTTIRRVIGGISQEQMQAVFYAWAKGLCGSASVAAADGKVMENVPTAAGRAQGMLNIFAHDVKVAMARYPIEDDMGEATTLRHALEGLFEAYPSLAILTGDAAYAGRSLCDAIIHCGRDYLFQVKRNQQRLRGQMERWFAAKMKTPPSYEEKKTGRIAANLGGQRSACQAPQAPDPFSEAFTDSLCKA